MLDLDILLTLTGMTQLIWQLPYLNATILNSCQHNAYKTGLHILMFYSTLSSMHTETSGVGISKA